MNDESNPSNYLLWMILSAAICINVLLIDPCYVMMKQMLILEVNSSWPPIIYLCSLITLLNAQIALTILYASILHSVCKRFRMLNASLEKYSAFVRICKDPKHISQMAMIDRLSKMHDDLTRAVSIINDCYAFPV